MQRSDAGRNPRLSCGIYAGPHARAVNADFVQLVNEVLQEKAFPSLALTLT